MNENFLNWLGHQTYCYYGNWYFSIIPSHPNYPRWSWVSVDSFSKTKVKFKEWK